MRFPARAGTVPIECRVDKFLARFPCRAGMVRYREGIRQMLTASSNVVAIRARPQSHRRKTRARQTR